MHTPRHVAFGCLVLGALCLTGCGGSGNDQTAQSASPAAATSRQAGEQERQVPGSASPSAAATQPSGSASKAVAPTAQAQGPSSSAAPAQGSSALPTPAGTLKKIDTAVLPAKIGSYSGQVSSQGSTKLGMYTGATQDKMLMVSLVKGGDMQALASHLQGATTMGHAVCGKQDGIAACVLPLQGGYGHVQGTNEDSLQAIATATNQLWSALA